MKKKMISVITALLLCLLCSVPAFAAAGGTKMYDGADILTPEEESRLEDRLDRASEKYQVEIAIATVNSVGYNTADEYIELFFDENSYGYGENGDGVLLLLAMEERDYRILCNGFAAKAITWEESNHIADAIVSSLSDGDYEDAFQEFIEECEYQIDGEINGFPFPFAKRLIMALVIGFVVALIVTGVMRGELKSVKRQYAASEYAKEGSLNITNSNEIFLYRTMTRHKREKESSRSSGSSRHVSGGKF